MWRDVYVMSNPDIEECELLDEADDELFEEDCAGFNLFDEECELRDEADDEC